ncbi:DEAD/DEAH box helicase [Curtobacterium sp. MCPF17_021]|uniref:DEAD/DEAH box helicase n=1 Tax=Curtobacterium sp. MCPF17_021 TaxID=2175639 RepID=UPI0021ACE0ED|nr:DEAD/DEAH box helicase [Curtobacterium sp. MCPF17_021]WIE84555.1 DEAD/DEAH box helicase [Curtobacterium sp. MCPF17_021]
MSLIDVDSTTASRAWPNIAPGSVVLVRDAEWLVLSTAPTGSGLLVTAQGLSELVRDTTATFYSDLDAIEPLDPAQAKVQADDSSGYRRAKLWLEATLRKTPVPLHEDALTVSTQMLADPLDYQRAAVRKALDRDNLRPRLLIADAVGLGKTIEIGMILSELVRRGRGERILIVTPKHVLEQMQQEMWTKFALPFVRLDSLGIQRVRQKLPATRNPFSMYKRAIISVDTLKQSQYRSHLEKQRWDAVVIDEAHNVMNNTTLNGELAVRLAPQTDALILASATPHNGKKDSFARLVRLLDPTAVTPEGDLIEDEVKRLIIRRHRNSPAVAMEVGAAWAERQEPNNVLVAPSAAEAVIAAELSTTWLHPKGGHSPYSGENASLFPWTLAKAFLSSPSALDESVRERLKRLRKGDADADVQQEIDALERLEQLIVTALSSSSGKYDALLQHAKSIGVGPKSEERLVVFSERVATLHWLRQKLAKDLKLSDKQIRVMHGGLTDQEQQELVDSFKQSASPIRVLITGDVASEGVNLHSQCHELVHFDIPWSLIRIEQRNGRIDRYGQKHSPRITTLLLDVDDDEFSGDIRVLRNLLERETEAHTALGDVASLMGEYSAAAEESAIRDVLLRKRTFDDAVPSVEATLEDGDEITRLMAELAAEQASESNKDSAGAPGSAPVVTTGGGEQHDNVDIGTGLFPDLVSFLDTALAERFTTPTADVDHGGVAWSRTNAIAQIEPTADLRQRLEVLPQSYLRDRRVTERLLLATTSIQGKAEVVNAINDKSSPSTWPHAHFLGPLHPVLDWAADSALSRLGRNRVYAVRGAVDHPVVVVHATLTNRAGQVVAGSFLTVDFPDVEQHSFHFTQPHADARAALAHVGFTSEVKTNPGAVDAAPLQRLIPTAVEAARSQAVQQMEATADDIRRRVHQWAARIDDWQGSAAEQTQLRGLREHRDRVDDESKLVDRMTPNQHFVRPLLVVVPADSPTAPEEHPGSEH